jgi:hypothetical protein
MTNETMPDHLMIGSRVQVRGIGKYAHAVAPSLSPVQNFSSGNPAKQAEHDQVHQGAAWSLISRKPSTGLRKNWHLFKVVNFEGCPGVLGLVPLPV